MFLKLSTKLIPLEDHFLVHCHQ